MQNITFSNHIAADLNDWLQKRQDFSKIFVITDENTEKYCLPLLNGIHFEKQIVIASGEINKNIQTVTQIWQALLDANADRNSLVLNLGGGVIGDMGGFAAATYKRGIAFVQIPTTLLAMVDASVGGKLGIDFGSIKNSVGVFTEPQHVFIAPIFLKTLPERILRSGIAEMLKHEAIAHPKPNFEIDTVPTLEAIRASVQIKYDIVQQDPFEKNVRKYLNFGHTVGHALESFFLTTDTPLLHGEAVALGAWAEAKFAFEQGFLPENEFLYLEKGLKTYFKEFFTPHFLDILQDKTFLKLMENDKKNENDTIKYVALHGFGKPKMENLFH
jgi:3-dehydroquinate synthase